MRRAQRASSEHREHEQATCHAGRSASAQQLSEACEGDTGVAVSIPRLNGQAWLSSLLCRTPAECARTPGSGQSNPICSTRNRTGRPRRPGCGGWGVSRTESTSPTLVQRACRGNVPGRGSSVTGCCHRTVVPTPDSSCGQDEATARSSRVFRRSSRLGLPSVFLRAGCIRSGRRQITGGCGASGSGTGFVFGFRHAPNGIRCGDWEQSTCE